MTNSTTIPDRSEQQRLAALAKANDYRLRRGNLKRDLKAGRKQLEPFLLDPPEWLLGAKVIDLLTARRYAGPSRSFAIMNACRISPAKTVGGLTTRQRYELAELLSGHGHGAWDPQRRTLADIHRQVAAA